MSWKDRGPVVEGMKESPFVDVCFLRKNKIQLDDKRHLAQFDDVTQIELTVMRLTPSCYNVD